MTLSMIEERQAVTNALHAEIFGVKKCVQKSTSKPKASPPLDNRALLQKAFGSKNGSKIRQLYNGDWSDYPSQSEADLAFCCSFAFWLNRDPERIDRVFKASGLYREKWDKKHFSDGRTYGQATIQKAIADCTETFQERQINHKQETLEEITEERLAIMEEGKAPEQVNSLAFPDHVMSGLAGNFAKTYGEYLEPPDHFFFMSYLTIFGLGVSDKLCLYSHRSPQPRYYTILLGESGNTRKSTAIEETEDHFRNFFAPGTMAVCRGAASGEGVGKVLTSIKKVLLYYDELKVFVNKCNIKNSTLLMATNTLFEATQYENQTSKDPIVIEDARLAMLAASTTDTYANLFSPKFMDIGFNNRLFLVPGDSDKCFPVPLPIPKEKIEYLHDQLRQCLQLIEGTPEISLEPDAAERWGEFYKELKGSSPYAKRLDTYGLRLMPLLAVNDMKTTVDLDTVNKVITLINWQHDVRHVYDPIDAEGKVAKMEEKIRRALKMKPEWSKRDLQRKVNYNQDGIWVWESAIKNLSSNEELLFNAKKKTFIATDLF